MNIEDLTKEDIREPFLEFAGFEAEDNGEAIEDISLSRGIYHNSDSDFSRFEDDEIDLSDYVPNWA